MTKEKCLQSAKKVLERGSQSQLGGASGDYPGISKTFDPPEFRC